MPESQRRYRMGVDIGGTFVDFALWDGHRELTAHKVPAAPGDLAGSIMRGIAELAEQRGADVRTFLSATTLLVHGTTVATNAVLTGGGSRTGLLTTRGTRDALEMRRGVKEEALDNKYEPPAPLVPRLPASRGSAGGGQPARPVCGPWARAGASAGAGGRDGAPSPDGARRAYSPGEMSFRDFAVYRGETLDDGCRLQGPAIVELPQTTLVVPSMFGLHLDEVGSFVLTGSASR